MTLLIYNFLFLVASLVQGKSGPPAPDSNRGPQLPIDENLWIILSIGLIFGVYMIYRRTRATSKVL